MLIAVDRGDMEAASAAASAALKAASVEPVILQPQWRVRALSIDVLRNPKDKRLPGRLAKELEAARAGAARTDAVFGTFSALQSLNVGYLAARIGDTQLIDKALAAVLESDVSGYPLLSQMRAVLVAERDRLRGEPAKAIEILKPIAARSDSLIAVHAALLRSAKAANQPSVAAQQSKWLAAHRGRAFVEGSDAGLTTVLTVHDTRSDAPAPVVPSKQ
jgi:hypothetical protein